jgi:hypothetical protein
MAFKILLQVIASYYFGFVTALGKDDPYLLSIVSHSLQSIRWARPIATVTFIKIDNTPVHDLVYILFAYVPAVHATKCMFGVVQMVGVPIEGFPSQRFLPALINKNEQQDENEDQRICCQLWFHERSASLSEEFDLRMQRKSKFYCQSKE